MRRTLVLALVALALLGVVTPSAFAQAPTPTFKITGLVDQLTTYAFNTSNYDGTMNKNDAVWYGRTRGRFDFIGEVGKAKGVLGIEVDAAYGQTGAGDNNIQTAGAQVCFGCSGSFDLNTDVRAIVEVKWLYTEFEVPLIPVPTVARIGAQPFGSVASYKLAAYANGDYAGINITTTITPNIRAQFAYVKVEEDLVGREGGFGIPVTQLRGDDMAFIISPEVTPIKGLDIKPMFSYFYASGTTNGAARQARGGINTSTAFTCPTLETGPPGAGNPGCPASGAWIPDVTENRYTVGLDARFRMGPFSLNPTVMYQFGNRQVVVPGVLSAANTGAGSGCTDGCGLATGSIAKADISAWLLDIRGGFQIGPLLLEALYIFSTGNKATDTTLGDVNYYQPLSTDTGYVADWGPQLSALGIDYFSALNEASIAYAYPGVAIGWDKYGRHMIGLKATYALTPSLSFGGGVAGHFTHRAVDTDGAPLAGAGILPAFATGQSDGDTHYMGTEFHGTVTWRFAPGLSWDNGAGYMLAGDGFKATTNPAANNGNRDAKDAYILTSRVRFTF
jgi:hypothetical protein